MNAVDNNHIMGALSPTTNEGSSPVRRRRDNKQRFSLTTSQPLDLVLKVKVLLLDDETANVEYGAMAVLLENLLLGWLEEQVEQKKVNWKTPNMAAILEKVKKETIKGPRRAAV